MYAKHDKAQGSLNMPSRKIRCQEIKFGSSLELEYRYVATAKHDTAMTDIYRKGVHSFIYYLHGWLPNCASFV